MIRVLERITSYAKRIKRMNSDDQDPIISSDDENVGELMERGYTLF